MSDDKNPTEFVLSQNLIRIRKKKRMSQETVARYSGMTARGYREIEEERYMP